LAVLVGHQPLADMQAQADAAAVRLGLVQLRRKERLKDLADMFGLDAAAGVGHADVDAAAIPRSSGDSQAAGAIEHGLSGVENKVEEHLLQAGGMSPGGQAGGDVEIDGNGVVAQVAA